MGSTTVFSQYLDNDLSEKKKPIGSTKRTEEEIKGVYSCYIQINARQIPTLREPINKSPKAKKMEEKWDNKCYRLSSMNEGVHMHYKNTFGNAKKEDMGKKGYGKLYNDS